MENVSGLKLPSNRSHSLTAITQKNLHQLLVLLLRQLQIGPPGKVRSLNFDEVPAGARSHPLGTDVKLFGTPGVGASALPVGMQQPKPLGDWPRPRGRGSIESARGGLHPREGWNDALTTKPVAAELLVVATVHHEGDRTVGPGAEGRRCGLRPPTKMRAPVLNSSAAS